MQTSNLDHSAGRQLLKFVLRRIEQDVEREDSRRELIGYLKEKRFTNEDLLEVVECDMIHKVDLLNRLAIYCYEDGLYDHVIPLLHMAHQMEPSNEDTLYNLGYILSSFQQYDLALQFLRNIKNRDSDVEQLISLAEENAQGFQSMN
jgi:tetratricopeptide (TPR) repeat protein